MTTKELAEHSRLTVRAVLRLRRKGILIAKEARPGKTYIFPETTLPPDIATVTSAGAWCVCRGGLGPWRVREYLAAVRDRFQIALRVGTKAEGHRRLPEVLQAELLRVMQGFQTELTKATRKIKRVCRPRKRKAKKKKAKKLK